MKNFENQGFEEKPFLGTAHEKAVKVLEDSSIEMEDFQDLYGTGNIRRDSEYVALREKQFQETDTADDIEQKKLADILEAILIERMELDNWLGPNAETFKTSKYDDIHNGVDSIVE